MRSFAFGTAAVACSSSDQKQRNGVRNKAVQAFWAMHVEAQLWSGLTAAEYASALRLSTHSLREWPGSRTSP